MGDYTEILLLLAGFLIIAVASSSIAKLFLKIKLPLITGLLVMGIIVGPFVLKLIPQGAGEKLSFVNDFALAFIAFAAGAELYLKELRSRFKSITWMTVGLLGVNFVLSSTAVFFLADFIPFMQPMAFGSKIAVSILVGTIFVARSPASAIAVVNELRAKGPFTSTVMGVTVLMDFLVIILFSVNLAIAKALITGVPFDLDFIMHLLLELALSFGVGYLLGKALGFILSLRTGARAKTIFILLSGYFVYVLSDWVGIHSYEHLSFEIRIEPLVICIIGSFVVTNYSRYRPEFLHILRDTGPVIYVIFFTLTGASLSLDILTKVWAIALSLFAVRLVALFIGAYIGGTLGGDPARHNRIGWMGYVTQAGVSLGLTTVVVGEFTGWGAEFATIIIAVIVLNQLVGPPLFKWVLKYVGESRARAQTPEFDGIRDAIIFGLYGDSVALARKLKSHGWEVKIASRTATPEEAEASDLDIRVISDLSLDTLKQLDGQNAEAIVMMLSDKENLRICELAYEHLGTKDLVVQLNNATNFQKFHELGALIMEPSTAKLSLLDHLVRSPHATSLLLGMEENQDTVEVELLNPDLHGMALRDLRLPKDIIILSIYRDDHMIISHGYTRLRKGDLITMVGSLEDIETARLQFE